MEFLRKPNAMLGLLAVVLGILALAVWVPADTGSGLVEKARGKYRIGDALAPAVAFSLLIFSGLLLLWETRSKPAQQLITRHHLVFTGGLLPIFALSLAAMRWTGPMAVALLGAGGEGAGYRELRDTVPWKYLGFALGGSSLVGALFCLASRKLRLRFFLIGLAAALVMILLYDLPFDDLLLPPNGDV